jgi:uncharacterized protein YukJ
LSEEGTIVLQQYGVLRGRVDVFKREDDLSTPHLQIRVVDGRNQAWRVPVNVLSADQSRLVFHRADPLQGHALLAALPQVADGFTLLPPSARAATSALDYFRAPLFDWTNGVAIPPTGPGANDDLQDMLLTYLKQLHEQGGELFAFGAKFPEPGEQPNPRPIDREFHTVQGVHDIHLNQGNPNPGSVAKDNGVFQDGGLILRFGSRYAQQIPPGGSIILDDDGQTLVTHPAVYIERALVNPAGDEPGREVVVIGNTMVASVDLSGWSIVDKNNKADILSGLLLPAGESRRVVLSGNGAQLGNKGGTITLRNRAGDQVHAVSYSKEDADQENRYIRFNT